MHKEPQILKLSQAKWELQAIADSQELGKTDTQRVQKIINYIDSNSLYEESALNLGEILQLLFNKQDESAMNSFRVFRSKLHSTVKELNMQFEFLTDNNKNLAPSQRECFIKAIPSKSPLNEYTKESLNTNIIKNAVPPRAETLDKMNKNYFIFHANFHQESEEIKEFKNHLSKELKLSNQYNFKPLNAILPTNTEITAQLEENIKNADLIIVLVSKELLANRNELEQFSNLTNSYSKRLFLIEYDTISRENYDLRTLEQYGFYKAECGSYTKCKDKSSFFENILTPIHKILTLPPKRVNLLAVFQRIDTKNIIDGRGFPINIDRAKTEDELLNNAYDYDGIEILKELKDWVQKKDEPYCILLGEYGMGKTVTSQMLSMLLIQEQII